MIKKSYFCLACLSVISVASISVQAKANTLAHATFDTDSYIFAGTNNAAAPGITTGTDLSGGIYHPGAPHFNFGVIRFDNLAGLQTVANGGSNKYLTMDWVAQGNAQIAVSAAGDNFLANYPSFFNGNATATDAQRLAWYHTNIKGNEANYGGYAGGAQHLGVFDLFVNKTYSLDVTAIVDAWIDNPSTNNGFGLWAVSTEASQGSDLDFASLEVTTPLAGPRLTSIAIPEPATTLLLGICVAGLTLRRRAGK